MDDRRWLFQSLMLMAAVAGLAMTFTIWVLYEAAFKEQRARLVELAQSQGRLIDAVARFDAQFSAHDHPGGAQAATLSQVLDAHQRYRGFGETGEFTLGRRDQESIVFLISHRHFDLDNPQPVPWSSSLAEPMRRALQGRSGTVVGLDYRGETVLAAHEPMRELGAGIVAKIDMAEIRAPFIRAAGISMFGALVLVGLGGLLFKRMSAPLMERRQALADLRKLSRAIEQSPLMVFITDRDGIIEYVNPRFTEMTGWTAQEAVGQNPRILKSGEQDMEFYRDMWGTLLSGHEWNAEILDRGKDGRTFWCYVTIAPIRADDGVITHFVAIHEDITERKLAEERLKIARTQADIANRAKSELLANMSHELRTPLNAIIGFANMLSQELFGALANDKQREYVEDIQTSGQHLLALINDILDVSAIEAGKLELKEETLDLPRVCEAALRLVHHRAAESRVAIRNHVDGQLPNLIADERRLKQILLNLLSNAIKFTSEKGSVILTAQVKENGDLQIAVSDTGIGMDQADIAVALTQFGQVDGGLDRRHEGTGLGLPLTVGLIEAHGGRLEIDSQPGKGTRVAAIFPNERLRPLAN